MAKFEVKDFTEVQDEPSKPHAPKKEKEDFMKQTSPRVLKIVMGLIVLSFMLLVVYAYMVRGDVPDGNGYNGNVGINGNPPLPNGSKQPINVASPPQGDPYDGHWVCGNGIADPGEDCHSCSRDLVKECACLSPKYQTFTKECGDRFPLCLEQKVKIDDIEIEISSYVPLRLTIHYPNKDRTSRLEEGGFINMWHWKDNALHSYTMTCEEKIYQGVWLTVDYPKRDAGEGFYLQNGQTVWVGDILLSITITGGDPESLEVQTEIVAGDTTIAETLSPGESISVGNTTVEYVSTVDGSAEFLVTEGDD